MNERKRERDSYTCRHFRSALAEHCLCGFLLSRNKFLASQAIYIFDRMEKYAVGYTVVPTDVGL